jgi:hypothetical protein
MNPMTFFGLYAIDIISQVPDKGCRGERELALRSYEM